MYQWTPIRHTRAIGAWPTVCRSSPGPRCLWLLQSKVNAAAIRKQSNDAGVGKGNRIPHQAKPRIRTIQASDSPLQEDSLDQEVAERGPIITRRFDEDEFEITEKHATAPNLNARSYSRRDGNPDLPLPPFMWTNPSLRDRARASQERRRNLRKEEDTNYRGVFIDRNRLTLDENKRASPFSTAFAQNPYARALAEPVREDTLCRVHLPRSCFVQFQLFDSDPSEHSPRDGKGKLDINLYPAALAAGLIPKKKAERKLTTAEKDIKAAAEEDAVSFRPKGPSSYVLGSQSALEFISEQPKMRVQFALNPRQYQRMGEMNAVRKTARWRKDMPAHVLSQLRANVLKRLSYYLRNKLVADKPGSVQAIPGNRGLARLDDVSDVICVLRLKPQTAEPEQGAPEVLDNSDDVEGDAIQATQSSIKDNSAEGSSVSEIPPTSNASSGFQDSSDDSGDGENSDWLNVEETNQPDDELVSPNPGPRIRSKSTTHQKKMAWWRKEEDFLRDLDPLPPPAKPPIIYFPTIRYRNIRVAAYNLPHLLGEEAVLNATKDTVFADSEFLAVTSHSSTIGLQVWLLQLAAYLGAKKEDTPRV